MSVIETPLPTNARIHLLSDLALYAEGLPAELAEVVGDYQLLELALQRAPQALDVEELVAHTAVARIRAALPDEAKQLILSGGRQYVEVLAGQRNHHEYKRTWSIRGESQWRWKPSKTGGAKACTVPCSGFFTITCSRKPSVLNSCTKYSVCCILVSNVPSSGLPQAFATSSSLRLGRLE